MARARYSFRVRGQHAAGPIDIDARHILRALLQNIPCRLNKSVLRATSFFLDRSVRLSAGAMILLLLLSSAITSVLRQYNIWPTMAADKSTATAGDAFS